MKSILEFPWPLKHYARWLGERPTAETDDYLYSQSRVRLAVDDDDQLVVPDGICIEHSRQGANIMRIAGQPGALPLPSIKHEHATAIVGALRSRPTAIELPFISGVPTDICERFIDLAFGRFVFAPRSLELLESHARAAEIVRFPGSPYELVRNYWVNVGNLNEEISQTVSCSCSRAEFVDWVRSLHVRLLLGRDSRTFYCPSSPLAQRRPEPGALYETPPRTLTTGSGTFLLDGPRVNASTIGGNRYHALLDESLGLQASTGGSREYLLSSIDWGRLVVARSRTEAQTRDWFLPPRPMVEGHWDIVFHAWMSALNAIERLDVPAGTEQLGMLHWCFVHLHPFTCANQSLAFAMVNWGLNRLVQCGIPHLILDQLALRYDCAAYTRLFARAARAWVTEDTEPAVRHVSRVRKKQLLEGFIGELGAAKADSNAESLLEKNVESARLALLLDESLDSAQISRSVLGSGPL